jgi:hypothetical protein
MTPKLKPFGDRKTVTEFFPSHLIGQKRLYDVIQVLRKFNKTCNDGRIKTLVIQKMIQIHNYLDLGYPF